jgi:hypothetical protein
MSGGFYPMLPPLGDQGFELEAPPARGDFSIAVTVPRVRDVIVQDELYAIARGGTMTFELLDLRAPFLVVSPPRFRVEEAEHRGVRLRFLTTARRPVQSPEDAVAAYVPRGHGTRAFTVARRVVDLLAEVGAPMAPGTRLGMVEGALFTELAQAQSGVVLVSDRIFDLMPMKSLLASHDIGLARALLDMQLERVLSGHESAHDQGWTPDFASAAVVARWGASGDARKTVSSAGFLPSFDRVLYAPQVPFATLYGPLRDDPDPLRDDLTQFNNDLPRGRNVFGKLLDLIGAEKMADVLRAQLGGTPTRIAAEQAYGGPLDWFFAQWLGRPPDVDYRIEGVDVARRGERFIVSVRVVKRGAHLPRETIELKVIDRHKSEQTQTWDGQGTEHTYAFELDSPLERVVLDPRHRVDEHAPGNDDPRFGDQIPAPWKLLLSRLKFSGGSAGVELNVELSLSRVRDLKNTIQISLLRDPLYNFGLGLSYVRAFGPKVTPGRLAWNAQLGLDALRTRPIAGADPASQQGTMLQSSATVTWDDRLYTNEPMRGKTLRLRLAHTFAILDDASLLNSGSFEASWQSIVPLADGQRLAVRLSGGLAFGQLGLPQQLEMSGGQEGLRAFARDELIGRANLVARAEYRHVFVHDLNVGMFQVYYLRGISGALFLEGALTTACESYAVNHSSFAADVGYTVSFIGEWFGLTQNVISLSIAVPLYTPDRSCFGAVQASGDRRPVTGFISFGPQW